MLKSLIASFLLNTILIMSYNICLAGDNIWTYTSDGLSGGSVYHIAISPNFADDKTIFINAGDKYYSTNPVHQEGHNGIFRSTDGGESWSWVFNKIPAEIRSIVISPDYALDKTVFAIAWMISGTVEGCILMKSINGGQDWEYIADLHGQSFGGSGIIALSPNFLNDQTLFVSVASGDFLKSTDGGNSYTVLNEDNSNLDSPSVMAISPNYSDDQMLFTLQWKTDYNVGSRYYFYKSADGGQTWIRSLIDTTGIWNFYPSSIAISPNFSMDSTIFVGTYKFGLYKSTDGGKLWCPVNTGLPDNAYVKTIETSPNFKSDQTVFLVEMNTGSVFKSTNGGDSWQYLNLPEIHPFLAINAENIRAITRTTCVFDFKISPNYVNDHTFYLGTLDGIFISDDDGATWNLVVEGISSVKINKLVVSPFYSTDSTIFAGTDFGLFKSANGGRFWRFFGLGAEINGIEFSPNFKIDNTAFAATTEYFLKSTDAGESWNLLSEKKLSKFVISPDYVNDNTFFGYLYDVSMYKSTDGGFSWNQINNGLTNLMLWSLAISPNYKIDRTLFAGAYIEYTGANNPPLEPLFVTRDGGNTWTAQNFLGYWPKEIADIEFSPSYSEDNTIFFGINTVGPGEIYKSVNNGQTWNSVYKKLSTRGIAISPNYQSDQLVFASGYCSIVISEDGGSRWSDFIDGLSSVYPRYNIYAGENDLVITPEYPLTIFSGSNAGVWQYTIKPTGVDLADHKQITQALVLTRNYPNPFNETTTINYVIPTEADVELKIYNTRGRELATLVDQKMPAGSYDVTWNGKNMASGLYIYIFRANNFVRKHKMMLIK